MLYTLGDLEMYVNVILWPPFSIIVEGVGVLGTVTLS